MADFYLEYASPVVKAFLVRLRRAAEVPENKLKILSTARDRILVELQGIAYLILLPTSNAELTPGRIANRVEKWRSLKGRDVLGHIVLAAHANLSPSVVASDGANLPFNIAAVGRWGGSNQVAAAHSNKHMQYLLELAGVSSAEIRRGLRKKKPVAKKPRTRNASSSTRKESPQSISPQFWVRQPYRGMLLDAYRLDQRLGRGHSAEVWKANVISQIPGVALSNGSTVAIKIYFPSLLQGFQPIRIQREFTVAADISDEHLARVYDLVISPSRPFHTFMVMEFVDGPTLTDYITASGKLQARRTARIGLQLFGALAELHSLGAIHRDVKAANIMLSKHDGDDIAIKLVDLGIVAVAADDRLTAPSVFLGSKHSAPLEQLTGRELDERTDIYGAGSVLFHCLRGDPMYSGVGPEGAIVQRMISSPVRLTADINAEVVEEELIEFVNRCIEVDPKRRPATSRECLATLGQLESAL